MSRKSKIEKVVEHLVDKQFEFAGSTLTLNDVLGVQNWFYDNTITAKQSDEFRAYAVEYVRKQLRLRKAAAEKEVSWFCLMYGLTLTDMEGLNDSDTDRIVLDAMYKENKENKEDNE